MSVAIGGLTPSRVEHRLQTFWVMLSALGWALGFIAVQSASLPDEAVGALLARWPDEYVRWIITDSERDQYRRLVTDQDRLQFIESFWSRRDPTPETPANEFRHDYLDRFAFVVNRFSAGKPGWATDRGRIYLLLGPPHSIQQNPMGRYSLERPSEIWTYNNLPVPGVPASLDLTFVDFKGTGDFEIVSDLEATAPVMMQFGTAESPLLAWSMRRGRLGMVDPRTGFDTFREVDSTRLSMREFDLQKQLIDIQEAPKPELDSLAEAVESRVTFHPLEIAGGVGAFPAAGGNVRVPVSLAVPYPALSPRRDGENVLYEVDYLMRLVDVEGKEAARAEDRLTLRFSQEQSQKLAALRLSVEETLEVPPGRYILLALLRDHVEDKLGSWEREVEAPRVDPAVLSLSPILLASAVVDAIPGSKGPFQFGTVRVIPSLDQRFSPEESLGLYLEAHGAATKEDGKKRLQVDFFVMREGRLFMGVPATHLFPDADPVGIRASIPLGKCPPGDYVMRVRVTDQLTGQKAERETPFVVAAPPGASR